MIRQNWFEVDGDKTLALNWPLNEESLVWEIGGFEGRWAAQMYDKFHCYVTIFEPQLWAVDRLRLRFENLQKIVINPVGLWIKNDIIGLGDYFTDGASILKRGEKGQDGSFIDYRPYLDAFSEIDVCLMNIEGAEYYLLPSMIFERKISKFKYFWCQFHDGLIDEADKRYDEIVHGMEETHEMIWDCYPTAVAWRRK